MAMWIRHLLKGTADETDEVDLQVLCLTGEGVTLSVPCSMLGYELHRLVSEKLPCKPGAKLAVHHVNTKLALNQTLAEQGIVRKSAMLSCTYIPTNVYTAWCFVCGRPTSEREVALEGVTQLEKVMKCVESIYIISRAASQNYRSGMSSTKTLRT